MAVGSQNLAISMQDIDKISTENTAETQSGLCRHRRTIGYHAGICFFQSSAGTNIG